MSSIYRVGLYTLGCKVSQYETEAIGEEFERRGFEVCDFGSVCDVYVINTCTVTAESDRKSRQFIRRAINKNPGAVCCVIGCYSQRGWDEIKKIDGVGIILGTENKMSVVPLACKMLKERQLTGTPCQIISTTDVSKAEFEPMCITRAPRTRAYVKIEDGCESRCSYCAISHARGRVRSKRAEDVVSEVEGLYKNGTREIVLTGIETGSYGRDFDCDFDLADLICLLDRRKSCERIRLGSLAPELIGKDFVRKVRDCEILAPHFHLSLQSGSDRILALMRRRYNMKMVYERMDYIRENIKGATFTTDLMVGFPSEDERDFLDTVDFVRRAKLLDAHVFAYSKRSGTDAAEYKDQVPEDVKRMRSERLTRVKNEVRDSVLSEMISKATELCAVCETLKDGLYFGHSAEFAEVSFDAGGIKENLHGEMVKLIPVSHRNGILHCVLK